jgi:TonB family protein
MQEARFASLMMLTGLLWATGAAEQGLEKQLTDRYHNQILALRHPVEANWQEYDPDGTSLTPGAPGSWTVCGRILVKKVVVREDRLQLEGNRVIYRFDEHERRLTPSNERDHVAIAIRLSSMLNSADEASAVLSRVFAMSPGEVIGTAPPYWRAYLTQETAGQGPQNDQAPDTVGQKQSAGDTVATSSEGEQVLNVGGDVTAPRAQFAPEPEFTDAARKRRFQGTLGLDVIIDRTDKVRAVNIKHPLGLGLDEAAVNAVSTWRFSPATRNGQPVAVAVYVEVSFRLYDKAR